MNQRQQYDAYVANWKEKHGSFVKPAIHSMWSDRGEELAEMVSAEFNESGKNSAFYPLGKYLRGQLNSNLVTCKNGKVIEVGADNRGNWIYSEWDSMERCNNLRCPNAVFRMGGAVVV